MRVARGITMPGEMFPARDDSMLLQPLDGGKSQLAHLFRIFAIRPIPNNGIRGIGIDIQDRSHVHIDANSPEFLRCHLSDRIRHDRRSAGGDS